MTSVGDFDKTTVRQKTVMTFPRWIISVVSFSMYSYVFVFLCDLYSGMYRYLMCLRVHTHTQYVHVDAQNKASIVG